MSQAPAPAKAPRALLIVIPCLNEEAHLPGLLGWLRQAPESANARIVVADGGSTDRSVEIVRAHAEADPRVILVHNPKRIQSAGLNLAARLHGADADLLIRIDAHAGYPDDFLARLIAAHDDTSADSVTVSMRARAEGDACFQCAAAAAQNSPLGTGGSPHRAGGARRWVEHGHHALFTIKMFNAIGGYDESFTHNEDAELDARLTAKGGRILLAADILIDYFPRKTARALARQYFMYGRGRARTMLKHRQKLKLRQMAPLVIAPAALLALLAPLHPLALAPGAAWLSLCLLAGLAVGAGNGQMCAWASGAPAAISHLAWSAGFWRQMIASAWAGAPKPAPAR